MKKIRAPKDAKKLSSKELRVAISGLLQKNPNKSYSIKHIKDVLNITNNKDSVADALTKIYEGKVTIPKDSEKPSRFNSEKKTDRTGKTCEGIVDMTKSGAAYIVCQGDQEDVYVSPRHINSAFNGDTVLVSINTPPHKKRPEGEVLKVITRASEFFIGILDFHKTFAKVIPDRFGMPDIFVDNELLMGAKEGEKVVVKIEKWPSSKMKHPVGKITTVLGMPGSSDIEMKSILIDNGFNIEFPEDVIAESEKISTEITKEELSKRRDFRKVTTFTIDPVDAKDFDDALSIQYLDDNKVEIGVHIADVSHYLLPDTALDKEAYLRSTSVYLVDRVCPMLPEKLSNELCSLRPNEDKLTFSAVFTFDANSKLIDTWIGRTAIHSIRRFTYEEAQERLETKKGDLVEELLKMNEIALKLRKDKFKNGAINFESEEVRFKLDENAVPISVYVKERKDSNMLIEDFMLLANKEVAKYIVKKDKVEIPYVYRIHDKPNIEKLEEFARFASDFGFNMDLSTPRKIAQSLNDLVLASANNERLKILAPIAIRTMAKAEYSTDNIGHYGLAFEFYSHFTSPIRRYSDVLAHRILFDNLEKRTTRVDKENLDAQCKHISKQERKANEAERESIKYKQVEFIKNHVGETFDGVVNGMIERGIFIELAESKCEGMVSFSTFNEPFEIEQGRLKAVGLRSKRVIRMGDKVRVTVVRADMDRKTIEFVLAEGE
jgi:ribonuclease R